MPHSHHSHSGQFCKHASGSLEDVVLAAIHRGFEVYGLTEHVPRYRSEDLYPEEHGMSPDDLMRQFLGFLDEAHRLKTKYASQIAILVGLETEYITEADLDHLAILLECHSGRIEYLMGSIHHVNGIPIDFDQATFSTALLSFSKEEQVQSAESQELSMKLYLSSYFDAQYELLQRFRPEVIGHLDLCRLYIPSLRIKDYPDAWDKLERNIRFAIGYGALFEINAAALRKGWNCAYPAEDVLQLILQVNGRFTLSDDSHGPHFVGLNYGRLMTYLRDMGVEEIWYLQKASSPNAAGRYISAVKFDGCWWKHSFWETSPPLHVS